MTTPPEEPQVPDNSATPPAAPPPPAAAPAPGGAVPSSAALNEYVDALKGIRSSPLPVQLGWAGGALGLLMFLAVLLPWETVKVTGYGSRSVNGFGEGQHGWIPFLLCLAAGAFGVFRAVKSKFAREYAIAAIAAGAISLLVTIIDMVGNHNDGNDLKNVYDTVPTIAGVTTSFHASVANGFGIWLALIVSLATVGVGVVALLRNDS